MSAIRILYDFCTLQSYQFRIFHIFILLFSFIPDAIIMFKFYRKICKYTTAVLEHCWSLFKSWINQPLEHFHTSTKGLKIEICWYFGNIPTEWHNSWESSGKIDSQETHFIFNLFSMTSACVYPRNIHSIKINTNTHPIC